MPKVFCHSWVIMVEASRPCTRLLPLTPPYTMLSLLPKHKKIEEALKVVIADVQEVVAVVVLLNTEEMCNPRETYLNLDTNLIGLDLSNQLMKLDSVVGEEEVEVEEGTIKIRMKINNLETTCLTSEPNPMIKMT